MTYKYLKNLCFKKLTHNHESKYITICLYLTILLIKKNIHTRPKVTLETSRVPSKLTWKFQQNSNTRTLGRCYSDTTSLTWRATNLGIYLSLLLPPYNRAHTPAFQLPFPRTTDGSVELGLYLCSLCHPATASLDYIWGFVSLP